MAAASAITITHLALNVLGDASKDTNSAHGRPDAELLGDGGYDDREIFQYCAELGIEPRIRIRHNATLKSKGVGRARSVAVRDQLGGGIVDPTIFYALTKSQREAYRGVWKAIAKYGRRSLVESAFSSFKAHLGGSIQAVKKENIVHEIAWKARLYNELLAVSAEAIASA